MEPPGKKLRLSVSEATEEDVEVTGEESNIDDYTTEEVALWDRAGMS